MIRGFFYALILVFIFIFVPVVNAQQVPQKTSAKSASDNNTTQSPTATGLIVPPVAPGTAGFSVAGSGMTGVMVQDMMPVIRESVETLKEMLEALKSANLEKQNAALVQKAKEVIAKGQKVMGGFVRSQTGQNIGQSKAQQKEQKIRQKQKR